MQPALADLMGHELVWFQPAVGRPDYELRTDDKVIASLSGTRGQCMNQSWTFKRENWFRRRVSVKDPASNLDAAIFRWSRREAGVLELLNGRTFRFAAATDSSRVGYDWLEMDGKPLAHFRTLEGFDLSEASLEIGQAAARLPELPMLVVLGGYLVIVLAGRRGYLPAQWSVWDGVDALPSLPELPDWPGLPDIDW